MRRSEEIFGRAEAIVKRAGTRNPLAIAEDLGIDVYWNGELTELLGLYTVVQRKRAIVMNNRLPEYMQTMVLAHEIGHDVLHREEAQKALMQEFQLFDMKSKLEYEANVFAAHLLLGTDEVLELAHAGEEVSSIAGRMGVNINLVLIKISELIALGYDLRMPMESKRDFLRDMRI